MTAASFPTGPFGVILADPPWTFDTRSAKGEGRSPSRHYATQTIDWIGALPVKSIAAANSALFLWTTTERLPDALCVMTRWGFQYKTIGLVWVKTVADGRPAMGLGYWSRKSTELCLLGTRGAPKRVDRGVLDVILAPRREHSRKPDEAYRRVERLLGAVPRIELFARERRPGWETWGDEVERFPEKHPIRNTSTTGEQGPSVRGLVTSTVAPIQLIGAAAKLCREDENATSAEHRRCANLIRSALRSGTSS